MSRIGQISLSRTGEPLDLFFDERELQRVIEDEASPGSHVTMYPGDYTVFDQDNDIEVPRNVSVTILPGATVDYARGYAEEDFSRDDPPQGEFNRPSNVIDDQGLPDHPLATGEADRYVRPNFTGHVENIVDMNFGSEWAFRDNVKAVQDRVTALEDKIGDFVALITVQSFGADEELGFEDTLEFRSDSNINIDFGPLSGGDGVFVEFTRPELDDIVSQINGGNKIEMRNGDVFGNVTVDHEETTTNSENISTISLPNDPDPPRNSATYIKDVATDQYGHLENVVFDEIANLKDREPRSFEGKDGDIWLAEETGTVRDIFLRTTGPNPLNGQSGDLWFVNDDGIDINGKAGKVLTGDSPPQPQDGDSGDIWLLISGGQSGSFFIQEIFFKQRSPESSDGNNEDIWTTEINQ